MKRENFGLMAVLVGLYLFAVGSVIASAYLGPFSLAGLRRWQTLIAGILALGAAFVAYAAAMKKVWFEERVHDDAVALKRRVAKHQLRLTAGDVADRLEWIIASGYRTAPQLFLHLRFLPFDDVETAWSASEHLTIPVLDQLHSLRTNLATINRALKSDDPNAWPDSSAEELLVVLRHSAAHARNVVAAIDLPPRS